MELMKKILLVLVCIVALNCNYLVFGVEIYEEDKWNSEVAYASSTIESGYYSYIEDSSGLYLVGYTGNEETVYLPSKLDGKTVVGIYTETFASATKTKKVVIPYTVNMIFDDAFINCPSLQEIEVSASNTMYASHDGILYSKDYYYLVRAPEGKTGDVTVLEGTGYICDYAFFDCEKITSVHIPASVLGTDSNGDYGVGLGAFYGTKSLNSITVDSNSKSYVVYDGVLYKLKDNTNTKDILVKCPDKRSSCVNIPSTVTEITDYAFYQCENLVGPINLPTNLVTIGKQAFFNCKSLDGAINIPDSTTSIGEGAFYTCESLEEITIGNGITQILQDTFGYCSSLKKVVIPNTVTDIKERAFFYCSSIESLTLGNKLKNIENWAFDYLESLKGDLVIPDSVEKIGIAAFMNVKSLDGYIIIGENVKEIGASAFYDSQNAKGIIFKGDVPSMSEFSFLQPDVPYYYLEGKIGFTSSVLEPKDLRVYNKQPVVEFIVDNKVYNTVVLNTYAMSVNNFSDPEVEDYNFEGWYYDVNYTREYNFSDEIMANTKVYAKLVSKNEIVFDEEQLTIEIDNQDTVKYTCELEEGATQQDIEWTSSNTDVATVDENGNVLAIAKGEAIITATYKNASDTIKIVVWKDENKLEITQDTLTIEVGDEHILAYNYHFLNDATSDEIVWESSDEEILTVEDGKLIALKDGVVTVTASYDDVQDSVEVTVLKNNVLNILEDDMFLKAKRTIDLKYEYYFNDGATLENIVWQSSNTNVAKVVDGKVTSLLEGKAIITATYKNVTDSITINVVPQDKFNFASDSIKIENTITNYELDYTWSSYDKTQEDIIWQSSNTNVATVENGVLTIVGCGEASISAICGDTADAIIVKVVKPNLISFNSTSQLIRLNENQEVLVDMEYYFNDGATYDDIIFESDNEAVIKIEDNKLIQVGTGVANITAKYDNVSDSIKVEVVPNDYIDFGKFGYILKQGTEMNLPYDHYIYNADGQIAFESSDEEIVKVDEYGNIMTLNEGEATITASYGDLESQVVIAVKDKNIEPGDINQDGLVDSADAAIALNIFKYDSCTNVERILGDMNEDDLIDSADAAIILNIFKYDI